MAAFPANREINSEFVVDLLQLYLAVPV